MGIHPCLHTDFYKVGHIFQYPQGTQQIFSNLTPRNGKYSNVPNNGVVVAGLKPAVVALHETWDTFFDYPTREDAIEAYREIIEPAIGPLASYDHIGDLYDLGYLPLEIKALPEGSVVPYNTPVLTITNTDTRFFWLVNYVETALSALCWKPMTTATTAYTYRKLIDKMLAETSDNPGFAQFQCHDFSARGMSGIEDAALSGIGHLFSFVGTDTIASIAKVKNHYYTNPGELIGCSVPATEHSVACAYGGQHEDTSIGELEMYDRLITQVYPKGIVSIVSDTWDYWRVLTEYTVKLKDLILARDGKVVFRPDSGDPVRIVCGDPDAPIYSPAYKGSIEVLGEVFGYTVNSKGYKVLNPKVGLIYGDSITYDRAKAILEGLKSKGWSSENIVFGVGSYTYQNVTRDTHGFAIKATWAKINGVGVPIYKNPRTDNGVKKSHKGLLVVDHINGKWETIQNLSEDDYGRTYNAMRTIYQDGLLMNRESLADIRNRLAAGGGYA